MHSNIQVKTIVANKTWKTALDTCKIRIKLVTLQTKTTPTLNFKY